MDLHRWRRHLELGLFAGIGFYVATGMFLLAVAVLKAMFGWK